MFLSTVVFLHYLVQWKPFSSKFDFVLNIFSTIILLIICGFVFIFAITDAQSS